MFTIDCTPADAVLWFLGQAGYLLRSGGRSVLIDPYLSDSVGQSDSRFTRRYPVPVDPKDLFADVFIVTHNHLDHLDPETITRYGVEKDTIFVAPHLTAPHLSALGVPDERLVVLDCGQTQVIRDVAVTGVFALGTTKSAADTTGYKVQFANGKSFYHTADTSFCDLLLQAAEPADVLLACINGKYGNMNAEQAATLAKTLDVRYAVPNHYDMMEMNRENPEVFRYACEAHGIGDRCRILEVGKAYIF